MGQYFIHVVLIILQNITRDQLLCLNSLEHQVRVMYFSLNCERFIYLFVY